MAAAAARAAEKELDEHSPSKVGYRIGDFFGVAFVNAIGDYADKSYKAGSNMAEAAKLGLSNAVSKVKEFIIDGVDTEPTIRPVLDLSNVESRAGRLNALFSQSQVLSISDGYSINGSLSAANSMASLTNPKNFSDNAVASILTDLKNMIKDIGNHSGETFNNTFNITCDDPRVIADEVSMRLQQQVERRDVVWK